MLDRRDAEGFDEDIERVNKKIVLEKELIAAKYMQKSLLLESELKEVKQQLQDYITHSADLQKRCIDYENDAIKSKEQLLNIKQTMSYRLGYSVLFAFKSWGGFKNLLSTINLLRKEKKGLIPKEKVYLDRVLETTDYSLSINNTKKYNAKKYSQYWLTDVKELDAFLFSENLVKRVDNEPSSSEFLDKQGVSYSLEIGDVDSMIVRLSLKSVEPIYDDKQAILTIDYLDVNGESLSAVIDTPYSSSLKKYYHYLTVNPAYSNNVLVCPPSGTKSIELTIRSWDNLTDILFDGVLQTITHKTGVSIVVPSYKGENSIIKCLKSLYEQTLPQEDFEVIIALNGERDSTRQRIEGFLKNKPKFNVKILELNVASASNARNEAIKVAEFSHITFIDDDDYVEKNYLHNLFVKARYGNVTLTGVKDVAEENNNIINSPITEQLIRAAKKDDISYHNVTSVLTMNACKMAPTHMVKSVLYNTKLSSGEDVVYWSKLLTMFMPSLDIADEFDSSVYYRVITENSVSRQQESYDFNVLQRLNVIEELVKLLDFKDSDVSFIQSKITAQASFIKKYLLKNSHDYLKFRNEIFTRNIENDFVGNINKMFTNRLVISYCFAPYADTSAVVMSKRINQMDSPVDVISNSMSNVRSKDLSLHKISSFNIGKHIEINAPQAFANWDAIAKFSELVVKELGNIISQRGMYKEVYSRAMWPASHFAAALIKIKYPQIKWIAEFSDPLLMDVTGQERYGTLSIEWLRTHGFITAKSLNKNDNLFFWCEKLVYEFADEIIFTNHNQKDYMLSYATEHSYGVSKKSKIVPQPTLDGKYYKLSNTVLEKEEGLIYIGYFGSFYINRGFDTFFEVWSNLDSEVRKKLRLYVYTQQDKNDIILQAPINIRDYVLIAPYIEYFDFLSLSKQFDLLLVMDAKTELTKSSNPYLPSKISDYLGADSIILSFVEEGSPMSKINHRNLKHISLNDSSEKFMEVLEGVLSDVSKE